MSEIRRAISEAKPITETELAPKFSEEAFALQFADHHADELRYVAVWDQWFKWDGRRWIKDDTREVFSRARKLCRQIALECNDKRRSQIIASAKTRMAVVLLAREDPRLAATVDQWDADPWLLNTPAGVIDLQTGKRRDAKPEDYQTKITSVAPGGECPLWLTFLGEITRSDQELISFIQRIVGYALTGSTQEHALFFFYGTGANGKSVFINTLCGIMADYQRTAATETFTATNSDRHPAELAYLMGARLVTANETEAGRGWAEAKIKQLTGGDKISARFMRRDFFEFTPQFKLLIAGNHKPKLRSVDEAIRRRIHLIPFSVMIPEAKRDAQLAEKLKAEWPGILAWAVKGCLEWQRIGLASPQAVVQATSDYIEDEDTLGAWLVDACREGENEWCAASELFECYQDWAQTRGERAWSLRAFSMALQERGFEKDRRTTRGYSGLTVWQNTSQDGNRERVWNCRPM